MKKLKAHVSPEAKIQFEFEEGSERVKKEQELLEDNIFRQFQKNPLAALFHLGVVKTGDFDPSVNFWKEFASNYIEKIRLEPDLESKRHKVDTSVDSFYFTNTLAQLPFMQGAEYITPSILQNYWEELDLFFKNEIKKYKGSVESYFHKFAPDVHLIGRIFFHLVENKKSEEFPFAFLATYASGTGEKNSSQHRPLKYALVEYEDQQKKMLELLSTVHMAAKESPFIKKHLDSGEIFHPISWRSGEALLFLNDVEVYEKFGILCRIPNWWKKKAHRAGLSVSVGEKQPSRLGLEALVDFKVDITVGGYQLTQQEVEGLLLQTEGLAQIKGQWVPVDKENLKETLDTWKNAQKLMKKHQMSLSEALRFLMNPQNSSLSDLLGETVSVNTGEWLESLLVKMQNPEQIKPVAPPRDLRATLRPYQQQGLDWLTFMQKLGFGSCLADDMGLGKTIQVLALMLKLKKKKTSASLLVLPASLLGNWASEIRKFASNIKFLVAHQSEKKDIAKIKKI